MAVIKSIELRTIFDSRGKETVEAKVTDTRGIYAVASAPSGTSVSSSEAVAFPEDNVKLGITRFNKMKDYFIGVDVEQQDQIDLALKDIDGTDNFSYIGGNVATAVSIAVAKLAAMENSMELYQYIYEKMTKSITEKKIPRHLGNVIGGGVHSIGKMLEQEILISPNLNSFAASASLNFLIHSKVGEILRKKEITSGRNLEGAWATPFPLAKNLEIVRSAISSSVHDGTEVEIGIDFAASEFYSRRYALYAGKRSREDQIAFVRELAKQYNIHYLEDPLEEEDYKGFARLNQLLNGSALVVGDDLYATNFARLERGIDDESTGGIIIKVNQVGTLTQTISAIEVAKKSNQKVIVSHRSGETNDNFAAHLAVAFGADFIKCGIVGGERVAKINEMIRIENLEGDRKGYIFK